MERVIAMMGVGEISVPVDTAEISVKLKGVSEAYAEAVEYLAKNTGLIMKIAESAGIEREKVKTGTMEVRQKFKRVKREQRKYTEEYEDVPDGYSFQQAVMIRIPYDNVTLAALVSEIVKMNISPTVDVHFTNSDIRSHQLEAIRLATRDAYSKAEALVSAAGCVLGPLVNANQSGNHYDNDDRVCYASYSMNHCPDYSDDFKIDLDINPKDQVIRESVFLEWSIEG